MAGGAPAPDIAATPREVAASYTRNEAQVKNAIDQATIDRINAARAARAKAGGEKGFTELAREKLNVTEGKKWEGGTGAEAEKAFIGKRSAEVVAKVDRINNLQRALQIVELPKAEQDKLFAQLQAEGKVDPSISTANELMKKAFGDLANNETFKDLFPDIDVATMSTNQKIEWIKGGLALDPVLKNRISAIMGEWQDRVLKFTEVPQSERQKLETENKQKVDMADKTRKAMDDLIKKGLAIDVTDPLQQAMMEMAMTGGDAGGVMSVLLQAEGFSAVEISAINTHNQNLSELDQARKRSQAEPKNTVLKKEVTRLEGLTATDPPRYARHHEINDYIGSRAFGDNLELYKKTVHEANELTIKISSLPRNDAEVKADMRRQTEENSAIDSLDSVIGQALIETYDQRDAMTTEALQASENAKIDQAKKDGNLDEARMRTARNNGLIETDAQGNQIVHLNEIRKRVTWASEYGNDGLMVMMAQDAGLIQNTLLFDIGEIAPVSGTELLARFQNHQLSAEMVTAALKGSKEVGERFNQLTSKEGALDDYRDVLMSSFGRARSYLKQGRLGRFMSYGGKAITMDGDEFTKSLDGVRKFDLKKYQWEELYNKFGEDIEKGLNKNAEAKKFYDRMVSKGVVSGPESKKWLMLLMMLGLIAVPGLGIGAGLGALGGVGAGVGALEGAGAGAAIAAGVTKVTASKIE